jgi:small-conductance mechanosensitive channel
MDNNQPINFKELWNKQVTPAPDQQDLFNKISKEKKSRLKKVIVMNVTMLFTAAFIILIWIYFQPRFVTTKIGIFFILFAMLMMILFTNKTVPLYKQLKPDESNAQYLDVFKRIKSREAFIQTTVLGLYFVILSVGLLLYMFEYASRMQLHWAIIYYVLFLAFVAFNWFYLRPKMIKKNMTKIDSIIEKISKIKEETHFS